MKFDRQDKSGKRVPYQMADEAAAEPQAKETGQPPIAVIVAHGMGQQVPFHTLGVFVDGLQGQAGVPNTTVLGKTDFVELVDGTRERLSWLEAVLKVKGQPRAVHFYEIYWAPITQGVATLRDVTWFLLGAGLGRITPSRWNFSRWLFGDFRHFGIRWRTTILLLIALAVVGSLVVLNTAIAAIVTSKVTGIATSARWMSAETLVHLTRTYALLLAVFAAFLLTIVVSKWGGLPPVRWLFRWISVPTFVAAVVATIVAAVITGGSMSGWWPFWLADVVAVAARADGLGVAILATLVVASWFIRRFLVQNIGDVAIYVESQSVDRFSRARKEIREAAMKTAQAVYETGKYQDIAFAGHSLGSVVAYDTLNQLLLEKPDRTERTKLLLTFGSPLDKTAYLFGTQVAGNSARELLAASIQPLIQKQEPRRPRWVNVYSPWDLIGGSLEFYDDPNDAQTRVHNLKDPDATTLLVAHGEHWSGEFLYKKFIEELANQIHVPDEPPIAK